VLRRLARLRVPLGFAFGAAILWLAQPTPATLAAGTAVAVAGEALRVWAAGHLNKAREVTSSGPYRWVAHPLYVGSSLMGAGLAIASASVPAASLIAAYLAATITDAIRTEEAFLRRTFGSDYDRYLRRGGVHAAGEVGARGEAPASARRFNAAQAIANREYRAAAGLAVAVLLLALKAAYNGSFGRS
jgi:hypothetical protein